MNTLNEQAEDIKLKELKECIDIIINMLIKHGRKDLCIEIYSYFNDYLGKNLIFKSTDSNNLNITLQEFYNTKGI